MAEYPNLWVEVERYDDAGRLTRDRYRESMGVAFFRGELVVYDQDGMNMANYAGSEYETVSWADEPKWPTYDHGEE